MTDLAVAVAAAAAKADFDRVLSILGIAASGPSMPLGLSADQVVALTRGVQRLCAREMAVDRFVEEARGRYGWNGPAAARALESELAALDGVGVRRG